MSPRDVIRPSTFEPFLFYGVHTLWSVNLGVRLGAGGGHSRMGRYGVLDPTAMTASPRTAPPAHHHSSQPTESTP